MWSLAEDPDGACCCSTTKVDSQKDFPEALAGGGVLSEGRSKDI